MMNHLKEYNKADRILTEHIDQLHIVSEALIKLEKIDKEQFESLMTTGELPIVPEKDTKEELAETVELAEEVVEETVEITEENNETTENGDNA